MSAEQSHRRRVGNVDVFLDEAGCVTGFKLAGRPLYLTRDPEFLRRQFAGEALKPPPKIEELFAHVSTDAIIKANPDCYYYDQRLGRLLLRSLGGGGYVNPGDIRGGGFALLLAGEGWGEGSSREVAALALLYAGIGAVFAPSIAPIHRQNLINNGMFPLTDYSVAERLIRGETVSLDDIAGDFDALAQRILRRGGLFPFMEARARGDEKDAPIDTPARPMTIAEKILAAHMTTRHGSVKPGDAGFIRVDVGFSHDYTTAPAAAMVRAALGREPRVIHPEAVHTFPDHLTLASKRPGMTAEALEGIRDLREGQRALAEATGMRFHVTETGGSRGICHTIVREEIAEPGWIVLGTDSHTCSAGALNALAYGIGNSEIASIWEYGEVGGKVPKTTRITLVGRLAPSCTAKDVILHLARMNKEEGCFTGRVMEFGGEGLGTFSLEEQAVLANMAAECSAITAVMEVNDSMLDYLASKRSKPRHVFEAQALRPDPGAEYERTIVLDLGTLQTLVATPSHPGNGVPLSEVRGTPIHRAYAGSCTAGDIESITMYADVLRGRRVRVPTYVQYGSERVREEAMRRGLHRDLEAAGVELITEPGCGACINAGPGGPRKGERAISATNRNMPGRMGEGDAYLANPYVVAASAVLGSIAGPEDLPALTT